MNAAGSLGFAPDLHGVAAFPAPPIFMAPPVLPAPPALRRSEPPRLGSFITNPVSLKARTPAHGTRFIPYPGGFLLHTGHPNPGLKSVLRRYAAQWGRSPLPVWVHLLAQDAGELARMVRMLEGVEGVAGVEIGLAPDMPSQSCRGFPDCLARGAAGNGAPASGARHRAGGAAPSLPVHLRSAWARRAAHWRVPGDELVQGRLYGPSVFPLALGVVKALAGRGFAVIGAGGIYTQGDIDAMLSAGAVAVQLDAVLWRGF